MFIESDHPRAFTYDLPVHELDRPAAYLRLLEGRPWDFVAGERFRYANTGCVLLAALAEGVTGTPYPVLVEEHVCRPAGMTDTAFLRSDALPGTAAVEYIDDALRTNVLHVVCAEPVTTAPTPLPRI